MLGDVGRGATVLATEREPLQQAQDDQNDRSRHADRRVVRQDADDERRRTHDEDGDEEGVLAADHVAEAAEEECAEWAHKEARRKREQREDVGRRRIEASEELLRDDAGQ